MDAIEVKQSNGTKTSNRRRVRRGQVELVCLRREAKRLESELAQLKGTRALRYSNSSSPSNDKEAPTSKFTEWKRWLSTQNEDKLLAWQDIAERQFKARCRAQNYNRELKEFLQLEHEVGRQLEDLLQRNRYRMNRADFVLSSKRDCRAKTDDVLFKQQRAEAEDVLLDVEKKLQTPKFGFTSPNFFESFVEVHENEDVFVMQSKTTLPFRIQVVENAIWNAFACDEIEQFCYFHRFSARTATSIALSFGSRYTVGGAEWNVHGKFTLCRFKFGPRTIFTWAALFKPIELNGSKLSGVSCHQTGWDELSELQVEDLNSTVGRSFSRLTVHVEDGSFEQKSSQVQSLLNFANPTHIKLTAFVFSIISKKLLDEDWKLNEQ